MQRATRARPVTILLVVCVTVLAALAVVREVRFYRASHSTPPPLAFEPRWRDALASGTAVGSARAPVTLVEFLDLQCPGCRTLQPVVSKLRKELGDRLAVVVVPFPIVYHHEAFDAARASQCASRVGEFSQFVDTVFAHPGMVEERRWASLALAAGIADTIGFVACLSDPASKSAVEAGLRAGHRLAVDATPTVIVNGWRFAHPPTEEYLTRVIRDLLAGRAPSQRMEPPEGEPSAALYDSGLRTLRYTPAQLAAASVWNASAVAEAVFGGAGAPASFDLTGLGRVALRSDGGLAVLSLATQRVLTFRRDGEPDWTIGGLGAAPSEFRRAADLTILAGDSLLVLDQGNRKLAWFDSSGRFVRSRSLPDSLPPSLGQIGGMLPDRRVLVYSLPLLTQPAGDSAERLPLTIAAFAPESGVQTILVVPGITVRAVQTSYGGHREFRPMPVRFAPATRVAVWNGRIVLSTGEQGVLDMYDTAGRHLQRLQLDLPHAPVTRSMRDSAVAADLARMTGPGVERLVDPRETERVIRNAPTADSLPIVSELIPAPDGMLWAVVTAAPLRTGWRAFGFRADGSLAAQAVGPAPARPVAFGPGYVIVAESDSDGVESLKRYRLEHAGT